VYVTVDAYADVTVLLLSKETSVLIAWVTIIYLH